MEKFKSSITLLAGLQWLFFLFANTIVIPISIGQYFQLEQIEIVSSIQRSFILTGVACLLQGVVGHRLALMEGQAGLWWGVILSLAASASALGLDLPTIGGSIAIGAIISGLLVSVFGLLGMGNLLRRWFTPVVMFVFLLLLANQLIFIFLKGMLGLNESEQINLGVASFSIVIAAITIFLNVKGKGAVSNLSLLIGMVIGWVGAVFLFPIEATTSIHTTPFLEWFPWGIPSLEWGIIITTIITGLLNTTNTVATLKGAEDIYKKETTDRQYRNSFLLSGIFTSLAGFLGLVPYAPYASSLGFIQSTGIKERAPFFIGSFLFVVLGLVPALSSFFSTIPSSVGNTILFVAYLQLFTSAIKSIEMASFTPKTIYRIALPTLLGLAIMNIPKDAFVSLPELIRPLVSNGLLIGILAALIMEFIYQPAEIKK